MASTKTGSVRTAPSRLTSSAASLSRASTSPAGGTASGSKDVGHRSATSIPSSARPTHYQRYSPEPITVVESWGFGYHLGNVIKYTVRAKHKGTELRDLRKALWYLERYVDVREAELAGVPVPVPGDQE